jgi:hypothetical protein
VPHIALPIVSDKTKGRSMRMTLPLLLCATISATGCARVTESRFNPLNWFGNSQAAAAATANGERRPLVPATALRSIVDQRALIDSVTALQVDRLPGGAIVTATGIASTQGQFNAQLVPVSSSGGTLTLEFRVAVPAGFEAIGTPASRQITAALNLGQDALAGIRTIRVQGARNARTSSR